VREKETTRRKKEREKKRERETARARARVSKHKREKDSRKTEIYVTLLHSKYKSNSKKNGQSSKCNY